MKILFLILALSVGAALAQPPSEILIYYDLYPPYGSAVVDACISLWPAANVMALTGYPGAQQAAFNTALTTGTWDIVIIESWYANSDPVDFSGVATYFTGGGKVYASCWEWQNGTSGQMTLLGALGVTGVTTISGSVIPHYAWETGHIICEGITDWGWQNPGLGVLNNRFTVGTALPVTGWTASATVGQAGICASDNGNGVVSGYTAAYANEAQPLWENILVYLWGDVALDRATWGEIKTMFD